MAAWINAIFFHVFFRFSIVIFIVLFLIRLFYWLLRKPLLEKLDDTLLELLLRIMALYLHFSDDFREHIEGFDGKYLFKTEDGEVEAAFSFEDRAMRVEGKPDGPWKKYHAVVVFKDKKALRSSLMNLLLKGRLDILELMLENRVHVYRNTNYVFRFLFLVNDLRRRIPLKLA